MQRNAHLDACSGYNKLDDIIRCGCWAHLRRKFVEAISSQKAPDSPPTSVEIGLQYCDKLFSIEDGLKNLSAKERYSKRLEVEKLGLDAFWCCWIPLIP